MWAPVMQKCCAKVQTGYGPPYGLLQGSLEDLHDIPPREDTVVAK